MEDSLRVQPPDPVNVLHLFSEAQTRLVSLLSDLTDDQWDLPTACPGWDVRDVALHLLAVDMGNLSTRRDNFRDPWWRTATGDTAADINVFNQNWLLAARRISPRLLRELLTFTGDALVEYHAGLDLSATGMPVSWVGPNPAPVWLDVARESTERWVHQQQIRDAVGQPGLDGPRHLAPVLATFVHALPRALDRISAPIGTVVRLVVKGEAGGRWIAVRGSNGWKLGADSGEVASATVTVDQEVAWRLWTKGISAIEARPEIQVQGDPEMTASVLEMVSIIA